MARPLPIFQVDSFTSVPFAGNPAGVCLLDEPAEPEWMQSVAAEMNVAETAFVVVRPEGGPLDLRWFSPTTEVDLCGHATLAASHVLWSEGRAPAGRDLAFATRSGIIGARRSHDWVLLDLPAEPAGEQELAPAVLEALGVSAVRTGVSRGWYVVEVGGEAEVSSLRPDLPALGGYDRGFIVTAHAGGDVVCRVFAPALGIDEDPVTGSAQCVLGPWWAPRLGTTEFTARQLSARGGVLRVRVGTERVEVGGQAVTTVRGTLCG